jgi:putative hemolysin
MVTRTDIMQALVGDIQQPGQPAEPQVVRRDDGSWLLDGRLPVDEVKELLSLRALPEEEQAGYDTLGGLVMAVLGVIPAIGQHFDYGGWCFEVVDMDGHRVDRVLVYPVKREEAPAP